MALLFSRCRVVWPLCLTQVALVISACERITEAQPTIDCAPLSDGGHYGLQASARQDTVYYITSSLVQRAGSLTMLGNVFAYDLRRRTSTPIATEVGVDAKVAPDGTVVFSRRTALASSGSSAPNPQGKRVLVLRRPGQGTVDITSEQESVDEFFLDRSTGSVVFLLNTPSGSQLHKAALAGGPAVQITTNPTGDKRASFPSLLGATGGAAILFQAGAVVRQPLDGRQAGELRRSEDESLIAVAKNRVAMLREPDRTVLVRAMDTSRDLATIPLGEAPYTVRSVDEDGYVLVERPDATYEVHDLTAATSKRPTITLRGLAPESLIALPSRAGEPRRYAMIAVEASAPNPEDDGTLRSGTTKLCIVSAGKGVLRWNSSATGATSR